MTLLEFLYISFPFGIATSATIRVGNLLGAGRPQGGQDSRWAPLTLTLRCVPNRTGGLRKQLCSKQAPAANHTCANGAHEYHTPCCVA